MSESIGFIIDVKGIKFNGNKVETVDAGWTFMPIQVTLENEDGSYSNYVNSSLVALPLWAGPVRVDMIKHATRSENPQKLLMADKSLKKLEHAQVIVRIHDKQQESVPQTGDYRNLDNSFIPEKERAKFAFSVDKLRQMDTVAKVGGAPNMSLGEMKAQVAIAASRKFGLE